MTIPVVDPWTETDVGIEWSALPPGRKQERILCAAGRVFSRDGLAAPMPAVAAEAGAGVASLYRQFPSKRDLLAALVARRLNQIADAATEACARGGDRWAALTDMLWQVVVGQSGDDFLGDAWQSTSEHPDVVAGTERALGALDRLLALTREQGRLRPDATTSDLRLLFAATRAARQVEPDGWRRMLELLIDSLDTHRPACAGDA